VLGGVGFGLLSQGPFSFRAEYEREVERGVGHAVAMPVLTEADIAQLPAAVQRYLRLTGAVGPPRTRSSGLARSGTRREI
jgi:hypothetical protein